VNIQACEEYVEQGYDSLRDIKIGTQDSSVSRGQHSGFF
jgi:hypothetical protein